MCTADAPERGYDIVAIIGSGPRLSLAAHLNPGCGLPHLCPVMEPGISTCLREFLNQTALLGPVRSGDGFRLGDIAWKRYSVCAVGRSTAHYLCRLRKEFQRRFAPA